MAYLAVLSAVGDLDFAYEVCKECQLFHGWHQFVSRKDSKPYAGLSQLLCGAHPDDAVLGLKLPKMSQSPGGWTRS